MPQGDDADVPQSIVGRRRELTGNDLLLSCAITVPAVVYPIWRANYYLLMWLAFPLSRLFRGLRPPTVVTAAGIRRPGRVPSIVYWSEVEAIPVPVAGDGWPTLALRGGKTVALQDLPVTDADGGGQQSPAAADRGHRLTTRWRRRGGHHRLAHDDRP
ncbi:hypothetical protein ACVBEQ_13175 [Nakamurella sp. GG22]